MREPNDISNDIGGVDRRAFLKATGVVVVAFSVAGRGRAQPKVGKAAPTRGLVSGPPDPNAVDSYIAINADNTATLYTGYVELGQGGPTALVQIAAEELDLEFAQVKTVTVDTFVSSNGFTAASRTAGIGGTETRAAAAEARRVLLALAAERLDAAVGDLTVTKGIVSVGEDAHRSVSYADLVAGKSFDRTFEQFAYNGGIELPRKAGDHAVPKPRDAYRIVGTRVPRPDIAEKVRGTYRFVQHVRLPGMLHGRVVWPRGQGAHGVTNPTVVAVDDASIAGIPAQVVRRNNFVGVVAEREWDAVRAARATEGHVGCVREGAAGPRALVRRLQVRQDRGLDRHRHGRRGRARSHAPLTWSRPRTEGRTNRTVRSRRAARWPT